MWWGWIGSIKCFGTKQEYWPWDHETPDHKKNNFSSLKVSMTINYPYCHHKEDSSSSNHSRENTRPNSRTIYKISYHTHLNHYFHRNVCLCLRELETDTNFIFIKTWWSSLTHFLLKWIDELLCHCTSYYSPYQWNIHCTSLSNLLHFTKILKIISSMYALKTLEISFMSQCT